MDFDRSNFVEYRCLKSAFAHPCDGTAISSWKGGTAILDVFFAYPETILWILRSIWTLYRDLLGTHQSVKSATLEA